MVRLIRSGILLAWLGAGTALYPGTPRAAFQDESQPQPKDQMFSGTVTAVDDTSLTVVRVGQGKVAATRTFDITAETRFEGGKLKVSARVTVRFVTTDEGDRAIHVIVRGTGKK
jgi:ribosomal protein S1